MKLFHLVFIAFSGVVSRRVASRCVSKGLKLSHTKGCTSPRSRNIFRLGHMRHAPLLSNYTASRGAFTGLASDWYRPGWKIQGHCVDEVYYFLQGTSYHCQRSRLPHGMEYNSHIRFWEQHYHPFGWLSVHKQRQSQLGIFSKYDSKNRHKKRELGV